MTHESQAGEQRAYSPQPEVQRSLDETLARLSARSPWLRRFSSALHEQTGERLLGRIDHLALPSEVYGPLLSKAGFEMEPAEGAEARARRSDAFVPAIYLREGGRARCALKVESLADFVGRYPGADSSWRIEGPEGAPLRRCRVAADSEIDVWVLERWGSTGWHAEDRSPQERQLARERLDAFRRRPRDEGAGSADALRERFAELRELISDSARELGADWTSALFFRAEREHWQSKTPAAQRLGQRQAAWGLGWANHDHHTYRCSRRWLSDAVGVLELLGLRPREAFHAGAEAGWGAQVFEHPRLPFVSFVDVDLSPEELRLDFAHEGLQALGELGTVGLWCGLHGEAMFAAGLHHLACHYDFEAMPSLLRPIGVEVMPPFADLPELRQAFTRAERRVVLPERIEHLLSVGLITETEARVFRRDGALGSHVELIERKQAYKGFHQKGINEIIRGTDPRRGHALPS